MADRTQEQLIDELLKEYKGPESFWGETGIFAQLKKKIIERTLDAEMDNHLGYTKHYMEGQNISVLSAGDLRRPAVLSHRWPGECDCRSYRGAKRYLRRVRR
jgi:hypothetical protein